MKKLPLAFVLIISQLNLRAPEKNNSTSFLPVGPPPTFHPPAHISICADECALVTDPQSAPYCGIIYFRDPNASQRASDFAGDERLAAPWRFVVEQDTVARIEAIGLTVIDRDPERVELGGCIGRAGVKRRGLALRNFLHLPEKRNNTC